MEVHQEVSRAGAEKKFKGGLADASDKVVKLHTATHLMNAALRKVLGEHVWQKGSNITEERTRFDFTHGEKMSAEQIEEVERLVNKWVKKDLPVRREEMSREEVAGLVDQVVNSGVNDFGGVMREVMGMAKGKADGKMVSEVVKKKLSN